MSGADLFDFKVGRNCRGCWAKASLDCGLPPLPWAATGPTQTEPHPLSSHTMDRGWQGSQTDSSALLHPNLTE